MRKMLCVAVEFSDKTRGCLLKVGQRVQTLLKKLFCYFWRVVPIKIEFHCSAVKSNALSCNRRSSTVCAAANANRSIQIEAILTEKTNELSSY